MLARYDFLRDIARTEEIVRHNSSARGLCILLTNDPAYWKETLRNTTAERMFRIHEGAVLTGALGWAPGTSQGTMSGRELPISLHGRYEMRWHTYAHFGTEEFRYTVARVPQGRLS